VSPEILLFSSCRQRRQVKKELSEMGVERAVTRWHIQHQQILNEIKTLEAKLADPREKQSHEQELTQQLIEARKKLHQLGPCPKPMMG